MPDERHARQILFKGVGQAGQARLSASRVLVVGVGATGGAVANSLARAGVGQLTLVDRDFAERSNLQRQTLLADADVDRGLPKAVAAADHLRAVDPGLSIVPVVTDLHAGNAVSLIADHDLVIDGTDSFATRYVINDAALRLERPWIYTGAVGAHGTTMTIEASGRPCLRCLHPEPPPAGALETCDTSGVLHPAVSAVAAVAAIEAMKLLVGVEPLQSGLFYVDLWSGAFERFAVPARADCAACVQRRFPALDAPDAGDAVAAALCGRDAVHVRPPATTLDLAAVAARLAGATDVRLANDHLIRFAADELEVTLFADGRAIVNGTDDPAVARSLYARLVGH